MLLIIVVYILAIQSCLAQFDEKFYFPSHEWQSIESMDFAEILFNIDNDTLHTVLFKSNTTTKATIFYYHGNGGNISHNTAIVKQLTNEGFQVFMTDYRGYGKSTGKPTHLNIAKDAQIIFDEIIARDEIKNYPVIIYGASIGTQIATKICKDNKEKVSALIVDGAMSSFTDMALLSVPEEQKEMISTYVTSPYSALEDIKGLNTIPKLFIHSKGDRSVPFSQGAAVYSNAPEPKGLWEYDGNHLDAASKFPEEYIQHINSIFGEI